MIWVGFDDNHDLGLTGGVAVAPIWADFMLKATKLPGYRNAGPFEKPEGIDSTVIDPESLQVATPSCPTTREEVYVAGSEPRQLCELHGGHGPATASGSFLSHIFGGGSPKPPAAPGDPNAPPTDANPPPGRRERECRGSQGPRKEKECFTEDFWYLWGQEEEGTGETTSGQRRLADDKAFLGDSGSSIRSSPLRALSLSRAEFP